jgi:hypothetical protein
MTDLDHDRALEAAARAAMNAWEAIPDCPGKMYGQEAEVVARAAVTAYIAALQETHALVPRLPNADMAAAGQWAIQNPVGFPPDNRRIITSQQVWIAMIDAAPPSAQDPRP